MSCTFGLARKIISYHKRRAILLCLGMLLSIMCVTMVGILANSIESTLRKQRIDMYGEQHGVLLAAEADSEGVLSQGGFVGVNGSISIYDYYECNDGTRPYRLAIGSFDGSALALGHIRLIEGKLPESASEAALEEEAAVRLGVGVGDSLIFGESAATYRVCGILRSYTKAWAKAYNLAPARDDLFPAILLAESGQAGTPLERHMLFMVPAMTSPAALSGVSTDIGSAVFVANSNAYPQTRSNSDALEPSPEESAAKVTSNVLWLLIAVSAAGVLGILRATLRQQLSETALLRVIGADARQTSNVMLAQILLVLAIAVPIGVALGMFGALGMLRVLGTFMDNSYVFAINARMLVAGIVIDVMLFIMVGWLGARSQGRVAPLDGMRRLAYSNRIKRATRRSCNGRLPATAFLAGRMISANRGRYASAIIAAAFTIACLMCTQFALRLMLDSQLKPEADYELGVIIGSFSRPIGNYNGFPAAVGVPSGYAPNEVERIANMRGVESVETTTWLFDNILCVSADKILPARETFDSPCIAGVDFRLRQLHDMGTHFQRRAHRNGATISYSLTSNNNGGYLNEREYKLLEDAAMYAGFDFLDGYELEGIIRGCTDEYFAGIAPSLADGELDIAALRAGRSAVLVSSRAFDEKISPLNLLDLHPNDTFSLVRITLPQSAETNARAYATPILPEQLDLLTRIDRELTICAVLQRPTEVPYLLMHQDGLAALGITDKVSQIDVYIEPDAPYLDIEMELNGLANAQGLYGYVDNNRAINEQTTRNLAQLNLLLTLTCGVLGAIGLLLLANAAYARVNAGRDELRLLHTIGCSWEGVRNVLLLEVASHCALAIVAGMVMGR